MNHVLTSETGMTVPRPMRLEGTSDGLHAQVRWTGLPAEEGTLDPIGRVHADVPQLLRRLHTRNSTPLQVAHKARREIEILK